jgi:hypothetical protein
VKSNAIAVSPLEGLLQPARVRDVSCDALTRADGPDGERRPDAEEDRGLEQRCSSNGSDLDVTSFSSDRAAARC